MAWREDEVELLALPNPTLRLTFFLDYSDTMIGKQARSLAVTPESFRAELAPARTFVLKKELDGLRQQGLVKGGRLESALVVDGHRLVNNDPTLRFQDEFVRHKMTDLLGDLYLLGRPLKAHVLAVRSGHRANARFVAALAEEIRRAEP